MPCMSNYGLYILPFSAKLVMSAVIEGALLVPHYEYEHFMLLFVMVMTTETRKEYVIKKYKNN